MNIIFEPDPSVAYWLTLASTVLLPLVVGLVTKSSTPAGVKAILLMFLAAVTSVVSNLLAVDGATDVGPMITDAVVAFVIAVAMHFGVWKPVDVTGSGSVTQRLLVKDNHELAA